MKWQCIDCKKEEERPPTKAARKRCRECLFVHYKGEGNPNFKAAGMNLCKKCGTVFKRYGKPTPYCSSACYHSDRPKKPPTQQEAFKFVFAKTPKQPRESGQVEKMCLHCHKPFTSFRSSGKIYCTYACHLANGGAFKAGMAAYMATKKYGAKKDANHGVIVDALETIGASVIDTSSMGGGFPDLIIGYAGKTLLLEIKNPRTSYGRRGLNKNQQKWKELWTGGPYAVVDSVESAQRVVKSLGCGTVATIRDIDGAKTLLNSMAA